MERRAGLRRAAFALAGSGWFVLAKRLEAGSFQLPALTGEQSQVQVDGATFASLLSGIDFTASRRGWYRRPRRRVDRGSTRISGCDLVHAWSTSKASTRERCKQLADLVATTRTEPGIGRENAELRRQLLERNTSPYPA